MKKYYKVFFLHKEKKIVDELPWSIAVYNPPSVNVPNLSSVILAIVSIYW
jgi:hypothetical protein